MVLISLSCIIIVTAMFLRDGSLFFNFISTVLASVVILTLAILDDLNNLRWNAREVSFSPIQPIYELIDRKEFYEKRYVEAGMAVPNSDDYLTEEDLEGEQREIYEKFRDEGWLASSSLLGYEV